MPDRIDREIEEILARLGEKPPRPGEKPPRPGEKPPRPGEKPPRPGEKPPGPGEEPISLEQRRRRRKAPLASRVVGAFGVSLRGPTPASMLFAGAGVMVAGLILAAIWSVLIWAAFAGVVLFVGAFIWSFVRPRRAGSSNAEPAARGAHWRGRYVEYEPAPPGLLARIKRALRGR